MGRQREEGLVGVPPVREAPDDDHGDQYHGDGGDDFDDDFDEDLDDDDE